MGIASNLKNWTQEIIKKDDVLFEYSFLFIGVLIGWSFGQMLQGVIGDISQLLLLILGIIGFIWIKSFKKILDRHSIQIQKNKKGQKGEELTAKLLQEIKYRHPSIEVIHSYKNKEKGDIDHIIISEFGIFICDTKNHSYFGQENVKEYCARMRYKAKKIREEIIKKYPNTPYISSIIIGIEKYPKNPVKYLKQYTKDEKYVLGIGLNDLKQFFKTRDIKQLSTQEIIDIHKYLQKIDKNSLGI